MALVHLFSRHLLKSIGLPAEIVEASATRPPLHRRVKVERPSTRTPSPSPTSGSTHGERRLGFQACVDTMKNYWIRQSVKIECFSGDVCLCLVIVTWPRRAEQCNPWESAGYGDVGRRPRTRARTYPLRPTELVSLLLLPLLLQWPLLASKDRCRPTLFVFSNLLLIFLTFIF